MFVLSMDIFGKFDASLDIAKALLWHTFWNLRWWICLHSKAVLVRLKGSEWCRHATWASCSPSEMIHLWKMRLIIHYMEWPSDFSQTCLFKTTESQMPSSLQIRVTACDPSALVMWRNFGHVNFTAIISFVVLVFKQGKNNFFFFFFFFFFGFWGKSYRKTFLVMYLQGHKNWIRLWSCTIEFWLIVSKGHKYCWYRTRRNIQMPRGPL